MGGVCRLASLDEMRLLMYSPYPFLFQSGQELTGECLLDFYSQQWEEYKLSSKVLNGVFGYLNTHWVKHEWEEGRKDIFECRYFHVSFLSS